MYDLKDGKKATPEQEGDLIRELQRVIEKKGLRARVSDERPKDAIAADPCTHCNTCPCMFIG